MVNTNMRHLDGYYQHEIPVFVNTLMRYLDGCYQHEIPGCFYQHVIPGCDQILR